MIKSFTVTNYLGESIEMDIRKPEDTGFLITSVTGITDPEADISLSDSPYDGSVYSSARVSEREITMSIIFYQDNKVLDPISNQKVILDIEQLRHKCYRYFPLKKPLSLIVTNDSGSYEITGYVKANEINIFTKQEGAQIQIECPDPYFKKAGDPVNIELSDVIGNFQFPVKFEQTQQFGFVKPYPMTEIDYNGASDCGIKIHMLALGPVINPVIYDLNNSQYIKILNSKLILKTGFGFSTYDEIVINTERGQKSVMFNHEGVLTSVYQSMDKNSKWITLTTGINRFAYSADSGRENLRVTLEFFPKYLGV